MQNSYVFNRQAGACCIIIGTLTVRTAVTILLGVSVAVRLWLLDMLERERSGIVSIRTSRAASSNERLMAGLRLGKAA
jgi:hypothetical protein